MSLVATSLGRFRLISLLEGISFVALLVIAMPLKYAAGDPEPVAILGRIHGGLFVVFALALLAVATEHRWRPRASGIAMLAAIVPLGAFWLERQLRRGAFPPTA